MSVSSLHSRQRSETTQKASRGVQAALAERVGDEHVEHPFVRFVNSRLRLALDIPQTPRLREWFPDQEYRRPWNCNSPSPQAALAPRKSVGG